jgi:hypothetical protein
MTVFGATLNVDLADYVKNTEPAPAQSFTFIPRWGNWSRQDTVGYPGSAVNDFSFFFFNESYHPNERGQKVVASEILQPLEVALDRTLGPSPTSATEPASHFFAMSAGATTTDWDDPALATEEVPASNRPGLSVPGLSVTDLVPPVLPSIVDSAVDGRTWSTSSVMDVDWTSINLVDTFPAPSFTANWAPYSPDNAYTQSADLLASDGSWDSNAGGGDPWGGSMETFDYGDSVGVTDYL